MEVILLERIRNLGDLGDKVVVKPGYARNYLIPGGKAVSATAANLEAFEARRAELEAKAQALLDEANTRATALSGMTLNLSVQASEEGKLFGSIGNVEITNALAEQGQTVEKYEVLQPEGPIHFIGEYDIDLQLHTDVNATIHVVVTAAA